MIDKHIDMVPVLSDEDLVGIITTTDILRLFTKLNTAIHRLYPELQKKTGQHVKDSASSAEASILYSWVSQTVREIMTKEPICLDEQDTLAEAKDLLQREGIRHLPVINEQGKLVGIVSDRDILRHLPFAGTKPPSASKEFRADLFASDPNSAALSLPLARIMVRKVECVSPDYPVCDAAKALRKRKISCLGVVDEEKKPCGIVTVTNLMRTWQAAYEPTENLQLDQSPV